MNFQAVSVGQKLANANANDAFVGKNAPPPPGFPSLYPLDLLVLVPPGGVPCNDASLVGGYANADGSQLHTGLEYGLNFVDTELGFILAALQESGLDKDTLVIIEAKHGQSPINVQLRQAVSDAPYEMTPGLSNGSKTTDDVALVWLSPQMQQTSYKAAQAYLLSQATTLGIDTLLDKSALAPLYGNPFGNNRTPDFIAVTIHGLIYTSGTKLAEHGGFFSPDDRNVALLVSNPSITAATRNDNVETQQIAATILTVLGINPKELAGARKENSKPLPGL
jgi:arylsulfatase A-like enzyme